MDLPEGQGQEQRLRRARFVKRLRRPEYHPDECSEIEEEADKLWLTLPSHFRWEGSVKEMRDRKAIERDFMISARLNLLHVRLMLGLAIARNLAEPESGVVTTAAAMLRLAVDAAVFKERLISSGTGLVWKANELFSLSILQIVTILQVASTVYQLRTFFVLPC